MARGRDSARLAELAGAPPRLATPDDLQAAGGRRSNKTPEAKASSSNRATGIRTLPKINLKAVAEACLDEGLDPAAEIARVLKGKPLLDDKGNEVLDPVTGEPVLVHDVDAEVRLRTLNSLLDFTQPRLKAVEMKVSGSMELNSEQLDQRLQALLAKAGGGKA